MGYSHLTSEDRRMIYRLRQQSMSTRAIGRVVGVAHSTVSRELRRLGSEQRYDPGAAQCSADLARSAANSARSKLKAAHQRFIRSQLEMTLSPEQISSLFPSMFGFSISFRTIYSHIYRADQSDTHSTPMRDHLRHRGRISRKKWRLYHGFTCQRPHISQRSEAANLRLEYGHWEMDLFGGCKGQKSAALVLVERKTRFSLIRRLANQKQDTVNQALSDMIKGYLVKSVTTDNGSEFLHHEKLRDLFRAPVFYCNPYRAWEKAASKIPSVYTGNSSRRGNACLYRLICSLELMLLSTPDLEKSSASQAPFLNNTNC